MTYEVSDLAFEPDGTVLVTYMQRTDLRCEGAVAVRHTARIAPNDQYAENIQRLVGHIQDLLTDALEDWAGSPPVEIPERPFPADVDEPDELEPDLDSPTAQRNWAAVEEAQSSDGRS